MPKRPGCLLSIDRALLERRYAKLLKLDDLASEHDKRKALAQGPRS